MNCSTAKLISEQRLPSNSFKEAKFSSLNTDFAALTRAADNSSLPCLRIPRATLYLRIKYGVQGVSRNLGPRNFCAMLLNRAVSSKNLNRRPSFRRKTESRFFNAAKR